MVLQVGTANTSARGTAVQITVDHTAIRAHLAALSRGKAERIIVRALNFAIARANTVAKRRVAKERNLKVGTAAKGIKMHRAKPGRLMAELRATGAPIPLIETKGAKTQTKRGVKANPGSGRRLFEGAFLARGRTGRLGVYERVFRTQRERAKYLAREKDGRVYYSEFPIREIRLPSIPVTMIQAKIVDALDEVARPAYLREVRRLLELEHRRAAASARR